MNRRPFDFVRFAGLRFPKDDCGVDCKDRPCVAALLSTPPMSGLRRCEAAHIPVNAHPGTMKPNPYAALWNFRCRRKKPMEFVDRVLKCVDCNTEFVFTAGEQFFFLEKQFKNDPKRCKRCKAKRCSKVRVRAETKTNCSKCGTATTVPFKPTRGTPILCRSCFQGKLQIHIAS